MVCTCPIDLLVVCIGGKSAGKSSLLENITKCSVFPRDRDLCTKRPVKLQLKRVETKDHAFVQVLYQDKRTVLASTDAILGEVHRLMHPLNAIADDEIIIQIGQVMHCKLGLECCCHDAYASTFRNSCASYVRLCKHGYVVNTVWKTSS